MQNKIAAVLMGSAALAAAQVPQVQGPPPSPVLLTMTKSGVLPVIPTQTPFVGVETLEGAIIDRGAVNPGFTGVLGDAVPQMNTPGTSFMATLPAQQFDPYTGTVITGTVTGTVPADGMGVMVTVNLSGFPDVATYGPFAYHVHGMPVPADGNCTSTLGHLDPTNRGEYYPCDTTAPQTCQAGDLSGKHGAIMATTFSTSYLEPYLSTDPTSMYYFGGMGIVVHTSNTTRLTCANFLPAMTTVPSNGTSPAPVSPTSTLAPFVNGAGNLAVSAGVLGGAVLAVMAFFA